jgi:hypothetical protein
MSPTLQLPALTAQGGYFGPAEVVSPEIADGQIRVVVPQLHGPRESWARLAVAVPAKLRAGDSVLIAGADIDELYVIGWLTAADSPPDPPRVELANGVQAVVARNGQGETLTVLSAEHKPLFEYESTAGKTRVHLPAGDVEFVAESGGMSFVSSGGIHFRSGQTVEMQSRLGIRLRIADALGQVGSLFALRPHDAQWAGSRLAIGAEHLDVHASEARCTGKNWQARFGTVKLVVQTLESLTETVVAKARNVYQTVADLWQLKSGRVRAVSDSSLHLKGEDVVMKSEQDFKIKAEQIHLG